MNTSADRSAHYNEYFTVREPTSLGRRLQYWWHTAMLRIARRVIPGLDRKRVLEVGAGHGFFAEVCQKHEIAYAGLEMNAGAASKLRARGLHVTAATIPPFPVGESTDVVWMSHVLEHAPTFIAAREMLAGAYERLEAGGHLVVICPDLESWKEGFWSADWSHGFPTTLRRVKELVQECGFRVAYARHHTATVTNPFLMNLLTLVFSWIPVRFGDWVMRLLTGHDFCHSFMTLCGWRQVYVVGQKPGIHLADAKLPA
jgi:SAM-dependent methyltransferase